LHHPESLNQENLNMHNLPFELDKRKTIFLKESTTDPNLGTDPKNRDLQEMLSYGIINIDKPKGPTSHQVTDYLKKILSLDKAGHSGTLDPAVTGVLPIAIGRATRIVQTLLPAGKEYLCIMHLHSEISDEDIKKTAKKFQGIISQMPPIKSAVKRQMRQREIYYFDIMEIDKKDILFKVGCQAGTYIRKLCHDFGKSLGTSAHMAELRRTKAGPFSEESLCTLQEVSDALFYNKEGKTNFIKKLIQPIENAVTHLPKVWILDNTIRSISHGRNIAVPGVNKIDEGKKGEMYAIMSLKNELVAIGTLLADLIGGI